MYSPRTISRTRWISSQTIPNQLQTGKFESHRLAWSKVSGRYEHSTSEYKGRQTNKNKPSIGPGGPTGGKIEYNQCISLDEHFIWGNNVGRRSPRVDSGEPFESFRVQWCVSLENQLQFHVSIHNAGCRCWSVRWDISPARPCRLRC